ncbi:hypothetical protein MKZ38_005745 [Zalerion maritima]|uniref:BTB domain-containing protein n=1 Tax=Zalerion maritima TaxID=339359 RepID=A0AAD5RJS7_9PEZI|nr:hypothetical protein MKZ38_005745 [Zalerion maritima]
MVHLFSASTTIPDATVRCGEHEFRVHKVVLAAHSPVFRSMLTGDWKEAKEELVSIDNIPATVEAMIFYMYHFCYNKEGSFVKERETPLVFEARMYAIAEVDIIGSLKEFARNKFARLVGIDDLGNYKRPSIFSKSLFWTHEDFTNSMSIIYSSTVKEDRGLRSIVVKKWPCGFAGDYSLALAKQLVQEKAKRTTSPIPASKTTASTRATSLFGSTPSTITMTIPPNGTPEIAHGFQGSSLLAHPLLPDFLRRVWGSRGYNAVTQGTEFPLIFDFVLCPFATMEPELELFKSSFGCAFNDSRFSDAAVVCGEHVFHVHRVVLCAHSPLFTKVFSGDWKVNACLCFQALVLYIVNSQLIQESSSGKYLIDDESPSVVEAMLYYMYHFEYNGGSLLGSRQTPMVFHAEMYAIAELYDIKALKDYARTKFRVAVNHDPHWPTDNFSLAIAEVYTSTHESDRELRDFVVDVARKEIDHLGPLESFQQALNETPGFAADMCRSLSEMLKAQTEQLAALTAKTESLTEKLHEAEDALSHEMGKKSAVKGAWYQVQCKHGRNSCSGKNALYHVYSTYNEDPTAKLATKCTGCGAIERKLEPLSPENFMRTECLISEVAPGTPSSTGSPWGFGAPCSFYGQSAQRA